MSTSVLLLGVLFSSIGLGYSMYGRKQRAGVPLVCGIALMGVPYFISSVALLVIVGVVLAAIPWLLRG
ncbi:hypothetical protein [Cognatilysobacter lacus]|uniref:Amino acid transport protein n=1 Tax=Cognatilysobacter lacus TaxID=1643323 RepID=A0A5D8Z5D2_9GAMM|nr:hypothetical protein [Lysobacter lacus]TZF89736.1 hypothetical protein FW784_08080 [Lysobacter lacus]